MWADLARSLAPAAATERVMYRTETLRMCFFLRKVVQEGAVHAAHVSEPEGALVLEVGLDQGLRALCSRVHLTQDEE
jgi:hypothetical protein